MYTEDGEILISTSPEVVNESVTLCHETGAICEAYTKNKRVVASVCVSRDEQLKFQILSPCGVCQERLWIWGENVEVAVPSLDSDAEWLSVSLGQITPHYWRRPFLKS